MVVLIDTNVIIDFLIKRQPYEKEASDIIRKCAEKELKGYLAFHSIPNLWYILRKVPEEKRRQWILDDFVNSQVPAVSPEKFLKILEGKA